MVAVKKLRSAIALLNPDFLDEFQAVSIYPAAK